MVLDAALEVHRNLGPAFLESVYENALCHELSLRGVPFERQVAVHVLYKNHGPRPRATRQLRRAPPEDGMPASLPDPLTLPLPSLGGFAAWRPSSFSLAP